MTNTADSKIKLIERPRCPGKSCTAKAALQAKIGYYADLEEDLAHMEFMYNQCAAGKARSLIIDEMDTITNKILAMESYTKELKV